MEHGNEINEICVVCMLYMIFFFTELQCRFEVVGCSLALQLLQLPPFPRQKNYEMSSSKR